MIDGVWGGSRKDCALLFLATVTSNSIPYSVTMCKLAAAGFTWAGIASVKIELLRWRDMQLR